MSDITRALEDGSYTEDENEIPDHGPGSMSPSPSPSPTPTPTFSNSVGRRNNIDDGSDARTHRTDTDINMSVGPSGLSTGRLHREEGSLKFVKLHF